MHLIRHPDRNRQLPRRYPSNGEILSNQVRIKVSLVLLILLFMFTSLIALFCVHNYFIPLSTANCTDSEAIFPSESGRYHLFASYACPGSHRALIVRALKGLEDVVSVTIVHPIWRLTKEGTSEEQRGWVFGSSKGEPFFNTAGRGGPFPPDFPGSEPDPFFDSFSIRDIYDEAGDTTGKYTVPLLWDKVGKTIVNNESSDIAYMLNSSFNEFSRNASLDLYTEEDSDTLNDVIEMISPLMIHGVYRCGFAKKQSAYDKAVYELTDAFDQADAILQKQRFLTGSTLTDADIRLFVTLFRFDEVYSVYFRANSRLVTLTPSLLNYCRDIYQMEGVAQTCSMDHCKAHFFCSHAEWNKFSIVPKGLGFLKLLNQPHNRNELRDVEAKEVEEGEI
jgi:putative glutathione S-transferase